MTEARQVLRDATERLQSVSETARLDAELLLAHAVGMSRESMILKLHDLIVPDDYAMLIERRMAHEPVSHITGRRDFWTLELKVNRDVLTPRPDSETLIEVAMEHFRTLGRTPERILDLGTGSGALLLAALDEWRGARGIGVDLSPDALAIAQENALALGMGDRALFVEGDWFAPVDGRFDLVLANPPYIGTDAMLPPDVVNYEPHLALFAGKDGLDAYRKIAPSLPRFLACDGLAAVEIGFDQGENAASVFRGEGLQVALHRDLAGRARCLAIRLMGDEHA